MNVYNPKSALETARSDVCSKWLALHHAGNAGRKLKFMTVLVDCRSQFLHELWKTSLAPGVATEESNVLACQEHSLCVVRQPNQQEYSPLLSMTTTGNVRGTSLEMHSQVATGKRSLGFQGSFPRSIILALPFSSAL